MIRITLIVSQDYLERFFKELKNLEVITHLLSSPPDHFYGNSKAIVQSDFNKMIVLWYIRSFYSTNEKKKANFTFYLEIVLKELEKMNLQSNHRETINLAFVIAKILSEVQGKEKRVRIPYDSQIRIDLLDESKNRCAICGFKFSDEAKRLYFGTSTKKKLGLKHEFVDFLKPINLKDKYQTIEIDHIRPLSEGGGVLEKDNLQILCFLCNNAKSNHWTIFEGRKQHKFFKHPHLGWISVPNRWIIVRTLIGSSCSHCGKKANEKELTVSLKRLNGEANPVNLLTTCYACDPLKSKRFIDHTIYEDKSYWV